MSIKVNLLDCSLRDGGYINDWEFGHNNLINVYERVTESNTDIIEVGFIDDRRPFDCNRSIFPDTASIRNIYSSAKVRPEMVFAMIDYGTCDISNIESCEDSFLDGIRVIFKKHRMVEAMEYCRQIKELGYKVCAQLVSITSYDDDELRQFTEIANEAMPYAVGIVDTYGLLHPTDLLHYYDILEHHLQEDIMIGFHAHNNLQLAYANAITFIDQALAYDSRDVIVDGSLYGMGKSAGNAPIELVGKYLTTKGYPYEIHPMLEAIEESVKEVYQASPWGYKTMFYLSSENDCHPSYVSYFENKGNLSVSGIDELLSLIEPEEKKLLYDKELAEQLYQEYVRTHYDDDEAAEKLHRLVYGTKTLTQERDDKRPVLIVGPGKNIILQKETVKRYIEKHNPYVIAINYIPEDIQTHCVFITKTSRYKQMTDALHKHGVHIIATSNVEVKSSDRSDAVIVFNREPLLEKQDDITDNSFLMLLKILDQAQVKKLALAGLDGYSDKEDNYYKPSMEYGFVKSIARNLNRRIREELETKYSHIQIEFVTYSKYMQDEDINSAGF